MATSKKAAAKPAGTLSIVATPIGNYDDITLRGLNALRNADLIVCEESKEANKLLRHYEIDKEIVELNEHNDAEMTVECIQMLTSGKNLALISDAGTPLLADPGDILVKAAIKYNIPVVVMPGASSVLTALVRSGFSTQQFLYAGFLSRKNAERYDQISELARETRTVILLDTPYRLKTLLSALAEIMPQRQAYIGCNLTMTSEAHYYGSLAELAAHFEESKFRGEFVVVFEGAPYSLGASRVSRHQDAIEHEENVTDLRKIVEHDRPVKEEQVHAVKEHKPEYDEEEDDARGNRIEQPVARVETVATPQMADDDDYEEDFDDNDGDIDEEGFDDEDGDVDEYEEDEDYAEEEEDVEEVAEMAETGSRRTEERRGYDNNRGSGGGERRWNNRSGGGGDRRWNNRGGGDRRRNNNNNRGGGGRRWNNGRSDDNYSRENNYNREPNYNREGANYNREGANYNREGANYNRDNNRNYNNRDNNRNYNNRDNNRNYNRDNNRDNNRNYRDENFGNREGANYSNFNRFDNQQPRDNYGNYRDGGNRNNNRNNSNNNRGSNFNRNNNNNGNRRSSSDNPIYSHLNDMPPKKRRW